MEKQFKVYVLKIRIGNIDRYVSDLEGTLSLSKRDAVVFTSKEKVYQYSGKLESFYERSGVIATAIDEVVDVNEWKSLHIEMISESIESGRLYE